MTETFTDAPWLVKALLLLFVLGFIGGFASAWVGILVTVVRTKVFGLPEDDKLPFFERWYRRNGRSGELYLSPALRVFRRMTLFGFLSCLGSMAGMLLLALVFGQPV